MPLKTLIVIGGATASGKTATAISLAKHFNTSILSADSRQCFREMNIGVAKPSREELMEVKHHFIDSHSIQDEMSAGIYEKYGLQTLASIFQTNDYAVCVGGTGLYLKALCEGIDEMPAINKDIEDHVHTDYQSKGLSWLQQEVAIKDPLFFQQGEQQNPHRLLRALVFKLSTGTSILTYRTQQIKQRAFAIQYFALDMPRELLYQRINDRVDQMILAGLVEEVSNLSSFKHLKSLQTVGYAELFDYLNQSISLELAIEKIKQHTRNYAKRQITWFKHQHQYQWISSNNDNKKMSTINVPDAYYENIIHALNT
ncbi:MAG: tRNA (adenosine(37)-N6)-dimethylallyltransferase MiaA [Bacteroidetes bacterium]|nr:tRNA (adenosine(37)-N6)-dimethylallyltransferase MiaA [Bacteroidota bacterium]